MQTFCKLFSAVRALNRYRINVLCCTLLALVEMDAIDFYCSWATANDQVLASQQGPFCPAGGSRQNVIFWTICHASLDVSLTQDPILVHHTVGICNNSSAATGCCDFPLRRIIDGECTMK